MGYGKYLNFERVMAKAQAWEQRRVIILENTLFNLLKWLSYLK